MKVCDGSTGDAACWQSPDGTQRQTPDNRIITVPQCGDPGIYCGGYSDPPPTGGCDQACIDALNALRDRLQAIHQELANRLKAYVLMLMGNTRCTGSEGVGGSAACQDLAGTGNQDSWERLLMEWGLGIGHGDKQVFDAHSPLTQALAHDPNLRNLRDYLWGKMGGDGLKDRGSEDTLPGGTWDYVDGKSYLDKALQLPPDLLGMATDGGMGTTTPDAFTGSYHLDFQVISKSPKDHSFTVAFAAYNDTGTASLVHFGFPDMPDWSPSGSSVYQYFFWTETFSSDLKTIK